MMMQETVKTLEEHFADWEASAFGYGYGTGEPHTLVALKDFMSCVGDGRDHPNSYDHRVLEATLTPTVAWLMINALCRVEIIEYGTSPRFGWLTPEGQRLKGFVDRHSVEDLYEFSAGRADDYVTCYPDGCNCGPEGYEEGRRCPNPFWKSR